MFAKNLCCFKSVFTSKALATFLETISDFLTVTLRLRAVWPCESHSSLGIEPQSVPFSRPSSPTLRSPFGERETASLSCLFPCRPADQPQKAKTPRPIGRITKTPNKATINKRLLNRAPGGALTPPSSLVLGPAWLPTMHSGGAHASCGLGVKAHQTDMIQLQGDEGVGWLGAHLDVKGVFGDIFKQGKS